MSDGSNFEVVDLTAEKKKRSVNLDLVKALQSLVSQAEEGSIIGFVAVCMHDDESTALVSCGDISCKDGVYAAALLHKKYMRIFEEDSEFFYPHVDPPEGEK